MNIWDTTTKKKVGTLRGHTKTVFSIAFSADGKKLASGGWDGRIIVWSVQSQKEVDRLEILKEKIS